jgi:RNA polymerase sigma factor (sigma-70 family)
MRNTFDIDRELAACRPRAVRLAARVVGNANAEDVVQVASLKAFEQRGTFDPGIASFSTWFSKIVTNTALDTKKSAWSQRVNTGQFAPSHNDDTLAEDRQWVEQMFCPLSLSTEEQALTRTELDSYLGQLNLEQRVIVCLIAEGFTYEEISDALGRRIEALRMQVSRLRKRLTLDQSDRKN